MAIITLAMESARARFPGADDSYRTRIGFGGRLGCPERDQTLRPTWVILLAPVFPPEVPSIRFPASVILRAS